MAPKATHPFVRICGDYRKINPYVRRGASGHYPQRPEGAGEDEELSHLCGPRSGEHLRSARQLESEISLADSLNSKVLD